MEIRKNVPNLMNISLKYNIGCDLPSVDMEVKYGINKKTIEYLEAQYQLHIVGCYKPNSDYSQEEDEIDIYFESPNYLLNEIDQ